MSNGAQGYRETAWAAEATRPAVATVATSEDALALEFTRRHHDDLLYVHEWGKWLRWDGARWDFERTLVVYDLARVVTRDAAGGLADRDAKRVLAASTVAGVVSLARADRAHARVPENFDSDVWALNTPDGTVDLRTGETRPHRRADLFSKVTPASPAAEALRFWLSASTRGPRVTRSCKGSWRGSAATS